MLRATITPVLLALILGACGGGGGGSGEGGGPDELIGDDARRAVLADIGSGVILPRLQDLAAATAPLASAASDHAANPDDAPAREAAQAAWRNAIAAAQFLEVLAVGPAARSDQPGGEDRRDRIYAYPLRNACLIDRAAFAGDTVDANTRADAAGLGAVEYLLFAEGANADCPPEAGVDIIAARAEHAARVAAFVDAEAQALLARWQPAGGNFLADWSTAGAGSAVYSRPQEALNALSTALFYVEKDSKDRKIACPTGIGATGLVCTGNDVSRVEHPFARASTASLRNNLQAFRDAFSGVDGGQGLNALLRGIERDDIAGKLIARVDATLAHIDGAIAPSFEASVEAIDDATACTNASQNATGEPAACTLHGLISLAMDTFRTEVVSALSLATPDRAAGDND